MALVYAPTAKTCSTKSCEQRHYAKGLCKKHYAQLLRHGRLTPERERGPVRVCEVDGCGRDDTIYGYCRKHARQIRAHGRLTPEREHQMGHEGCSIPRCKEPHRAIGLCARHYNQERWARIVQARQEASERAARKKRRA